MDSSPRPLTIMLADSVRMWGGAQKWVVELGEGLQKRGHRVVVQTHPGVPLVERARERGLVVREVGTRMDSAPWTVLPVATHIRRMRYDAIITSFDKDLRTTGLAAKVACAGTKVLHFRHNDDPLKDKARHRWFFTRIADHVAVNSQATLDTTLRTAPWLDRDHTSVIYNGIDLSDYDPPDAGTWSERLRPTGSEVVVGYAGQLIERKRVDLLIRALASDHVNALPWRLAIAGEGAETDRLRGLAHELAVGERIDFCGFVNDLPAWMAAIDFLVLPSLVEGFGYVLAEAAAAGKPSVAFRASSIPEVVVEGETALLADPADSNEFTEHIAYMIAEDDKRLAMGEAARRDAFARHGLDRMVGKIEDRLLRLVNDTD